MLVHLGKLLYGWLYAFLYPQSCNFCREQLGEREPLCSRCLNLIKPTLSVRLNLSHGFFLHVYGICTYEEPLKTLIVAKYRRSYEESEHLGTLIWRLSVMPTLDADYLIPIPLHSARLSSRGYNQAKVIAQRISHLSSIPVLDCIVRIRNTSPQSLCPLSQRFNNVRGAFEVRNVELLKGKRVVLVDDLMSSGATLSEVARLLYAYKVVQMKAVVGCIYSR